MAVSLGPFQLEHPFILAPMAGITNSPFRRLMRQMKSSLVVSELVSANGLHYASERTKRMLAFHDDERVVGLQVFSESPERLAFAAQYVENLGADFVDLNLGCPVNKIIKKGAGSAMCKDVPALRKTLEGMVRAVKIPVSIKIRTGWDAHSINAHEVVQAAYDAGVAWVAVHGRTRAQGYSGRSDWDLIAEIKSRAPLPIIGNGDLTTPELAVEHYKKYEVDAVMIGRGALRNPFIFDQAVCCLEGKPYTVPGPDGYLDLMQKQKEYLEESFEPKKVLLQVRKFFAWYAAGYPGCHEFRRRVFAIPDPDELWQEARVFFEGVHRRDTKHLQQPFLMGGHG